MAEEAKTPASASVRSDDKVAPARGPPPSAARQKTYVVENGGILDFDTKKAILRLVMMEVGRTVTATTSGPDGEEVGRPVTGPDGEEVTRPVILVNQTTREVSVHLDNIDNPDVILHIYNIVSNRRATLNEPANSGKRG